MLGSPTLDYPDLDLEWRHLFLVSRKTDDFICFSTLVFSMDKAKETVLRAQRALNQGD